MNEIIKEKQIENLIYEIRGQQVMIDRDLARLYQSKNGTKDINKAVKRNIERFPDDFYFQLNKEETTQLRFQNGTTNMSRTFPHVFTEQGIAMLATVLKTDVATEMSVRIMRAFVSMRKYISTNLLEQKYINNQVMKNTEDIKLLQDSFSKFESNKKVNEIYFNGQIYDAYSKIIDILNTANKNIIIIDNYIDKKFLDICSKINIILLFILIKLI